MTYEPKVETHYVVRVVFERVDKTTRTVSQTEQPATRDVSEVANFTLKAEDLESLKGRLQNHVGLVQE